MTRERKRDVLIVAVAAVLVGAASAQAQDHRVVVFGHIGGASIGHSDSRQGSAPLFGGGVGVHLTRRIIVDSDVHGAQVTHVFGREHHDFSQVTLTGSLLFRSSPDARVHALAGGGLAVQRARSAFTFEPVGLIELTETVRLLHGRGGAEWDVSSRVIVRTEALLWMGGGLDWVIGGRVAAGYRF